MDCPPSPKRGKQLRPDQRVCPHCDQIVAYKTFRRHRRLYYNSETKQWFQDSQSAASEGLRSSVAVGDEVLSASPGEEVYQYCVLELSPPPPDRPSSSHEESPPLSEPGSMSSSESSRNTDSKLLKKVMIRILIAITWLYREKLNMV